MEALYAHLTTPDRAHEYSRSNTGHGSRPKHTSQGRGHTRKDRDTMTQRTTHTSTPQYFPPMADPMRPEAMTRPQLIDAWQDAASEVACMTALGYTADTDPDTREAWKYMRQLERELMKREIYTAQDMRADREAMEHRYRRMQ